MSLQDLLLRVPPLQDWTEVRVGQGVAHALTAPCHWGLRHLDRAWHWLLRCVPGRGHPQCSADGRSCPEVPWRKRRRRWMQQRMTMPIRPKTELTVTFTRPSRLVWHVTWQNPTGDPKGRLG